VGPCGRLFRDAVGGKRAGGGDRRNLFVWTVNEEEWMEWSIRKGVDGVVTDDPKKFLDVCRRWEARLAGGGGGGGGIGSDDGGRAAGVRRGVRLAGLYAGALLTQVATLLLTAVMWRRLNYQPSEKKEGGGTGESAITEGLEGVEVVAAAAAGKT